MIGGAVACATQETPLYSDGACVAGGCPLASSSASSVAATTTGSSGGGCMVDAGCSVSWSKDIFANILESTAGCTAMSCHGGGADGILLTQGQAHTAYISLLGTTLATSPGPAKAYIVPCDVAASGFPCNMSPAVDAGGNPYGECGTLMPLGSSNGLTMDQITAIATWIQCGAPEN